MRFPATADPTTNDTGRKSCLGGPVHDGLGASVHLQTEGASLVGPLFPHGSPAAVGRCVVPVRVFSVNGVSRRAWSHVLVERIEVQPAGAHFDPPAPVVCPRNVVRVGTPGKHRPPRLVFGRTREPVGCIAFLATAGTLPSRSEVFQQHLRYASARASDLDAAVLVPLTGKITKHHKVTKRISWGHYDTSLLTAAAGFRATGSEVAQLPDTHFPAYAPDLDTSRATSGRDITNYRPEAVGIRCRIHAPEITIVGRWGST